MSPYSFRNRTRPRSIPMVRRDSSGRGTLAARPTTWPRLNTSPCPQRWRRSYSHAACPPRCSPLPPTRPAPAAADAEPSRSIVIYLATIGNTSPHPVSNRKPQPSLLNAQWNSWWKCLCVIVVERLMATAVPSLTDREVGRSSPDIESSAELPRTRGQRTGFGVVVAVVTSTITSYSVTTTTMRTTAQLATTSAIFCLPFGYTVCWTHQCRFVSCRLPRVSEVSNSKKYLIIYFFRCYTLFFLFLEERPILVFNINLLPRYHWKWKSIYNWNRFCFTQWLANNK